MISSKPTQASVVSKVHVMAGLERPPLGRVQTQSLTADLAEFDNQSKALFAEAEALRANATGSERRFLDDFTSLLIHESNLLAPARAALSEGIVDVETAELALQRMAAMNMQFLALQQAVQLQSQSFRSLSNAAKARHDIAMNLKA